MEFGVGSVGKLEVGQRLRLSQRHGVEGLHIMIPMEAGPILNVETDGIMTLSGAEPSLGYNIYKFAWEYRRVSCNEERLLLYIDCFQRVLPRVAADHYPLILSCEDIPRPANVLFRFQRFWCEYPEFHDVVQRSVFSKVDIEALRSTVDVANFQEKIKTVGLNASSKAMEDEKVGSFQKALSLQEKLWADESSMVEMWGS
ncbi:hypothetical protein NE237_004289 [Protea cynaroides]|uniref:Uncharacterized protein n=1 Tax=Protea cynaroides TaxID=273540 RepID=A0A9Q0QTF2_9MAGN|nr:hypothetical protein NE237_004289 [Protea cynaroides]